MIYTARPNPSTDWTFGDVCQMVRAGAKLVRYSLTAGRVGFAYNSTEATVPADYLTRMIASGAIMLESRNGGDPAVYVCPIIYTAANLEVAR